MKKNKKTTRCTRSASTTGQAARGAKACRSEADIPPKAGVESFSPSPHREEGTLYSPSLDGRGQGEGDHIDLYVAK
jgi:hypothetical protein